ncbi:RraA family protein [Kitasatospora cineracea]|uniref:RraA family protein n=1 Tax=Kitasatospora cineracea TaxID=88074 RepID=UPI00341C97F3
MTRNSSPAAPELAVLTGTGTSAVSDALDLMGENGPVFGLHRQSGSGVVVGPAFTVAFEPVPEGVRAPAADFLDDVPPGSVVVIANQGRPCTVWGDILAETALARGVAGTVIDGLCRDVDGIRELGYSVWAHGAFMRSGKNRVRMAAVQQPVLLGHGGEARTVRPGDVVCADGSGVTVVPAALLGEVAERVGRIAAMEQAVLADVRAGMPLREARAKHGYNEVARRPEGDRQR